MSIKWAQQSAYALVPADLGLNGLQWSIDPPAGWSKSSARGVHEETLQTLLSLHLSEVSCEPVQLVGKAGDYWGGEDIVGLDTLGRVHLFELKRGRVSEDAARQLSYYMLRHVFNEPARFIESWWKRIGEWELRVERLSETIAGALAGQQTHNVGYFFVREWAKAATTSKYAWKKQSYDEKHPLLLRALLEKAKERLDQVPTKDEVAEIAKVWRSRLWSEGGPARSAFVCERPVVIWLVGTGFTPEVEEEIRRWRAAGVDARCLQAEVRFSSRRDGLILRVAREEAPGRVELVKLLEHWAASNRASNASAKLTVQLYVVARASDKGKQKEAAGRPKEPPSARIEWHAGESIELVALKD